MLSDHYVFWLQVVINNAMTMHRLQLLKNEHTQVHDRFQRELISEIIIIARELRTNALHNDVVLLPGLLFVDLAPAVGLRYALVDGAIEDDADVKGFFVFV